MLRDVQINVSREVFVSHTVQKGSHVNFLVAPKIGRSRENVVLMDQRERDVRWRAALKVQHKAESALVTVGRRNSVERKNA